MPFPVIIRPIHEMSSEADKTLDLLLTKYMKAYISYEGAQRVERFIVPRNALREALLYAIVHRDYSSGIPIQISVYDDKIYIWNDGQLPQDWTVKRLLEKHPSKPYNPLIANAFFRTGQIEAWGRGIEKIQQECQAAGVDCPAFKYETTGLMLEFKSKLLPEDSEKSSEKTREKILVAIQADPHMTTAELSRTTGLTAKGVEWNIKKLKADGRLRRIGPSRGGRWEVIGAPNDPLRENAN